MYNGKRAASQASEAIKATRSSPQMKRPFRSGNGHPIGYRPSPALRVNRWQVVTLTHLSRCSIERMVELHNGVRTHLYGVFCPCISTHFCNYVAS
jgi:hypothetical protein